MKEMISYRQSVFLASLILPVTGHMLLLEPLFSHSNNEAWASILCSLPIGVGYGFILYRLHTLNPSQTFVKMLEQAFGCFVGKILTIGVIGYFFFMLIITFYSLFDFVQVVFLPETPKWALSISFYFVVLFAVYVGIESIARVSEAILPLIIISGSSIAIATQPLKDYTNLLPLFENGYTPLLNGLLIASAWWGELFFLIMLGLKKDHSKSKSFFFTNTVAVILLMIMFLGTTISSLAIFGEKQVHNLEYPAQTIARLVTFGFIERFDIYGITVMVLGSMVRMSTFQTVLNIAIQQWLGIQKKWWIHGAISLSILLITLVGIRNHQYFEEVIMNRYYPLTVFLSLGLPVITWIVIEWRTMRNKIR